MNTLTSRFQAGSKVMIDGDQALVATVTAHLFRGGVVQCECCWFVNGAHQAVWIDEWRLAAAP